MQTQELIDRLEYKSYELRRKLLELTGKIGGAHIGGSFSMMEMMVALHYHYMNIDPAKPKKEDRDIFILSKGHAGVGYCVLLGDRGFFPEEELEHFNQTGSYFGVHPDRKGIPGVEASTGSLGHGLGLGMGIALAKKMDLKVNAKSPAANARVFVMMSDGELCEGSVWEAFMAARHHKVGNLVCFVDYNKMSQDGPISAIMEVAPVKEKIQAFGWNVIEIDGHDMKQVLGALEKLPGADATKPTAIVMNTIKGKGVPWRENSVTWHYGGLDTEAEAKALADLDKAHEKLLARLGRPESKEGKGN
jgi:transketolase